jgi:hypothetical protein
MRVAITGSSGLIGTELREHFRSRGDEVTRIVRGPSPRGDGNEVVWNVDRGVIDTAALEGVDLVVHLAGENIAGVWTSDKKRRIRDSRVKGTTLLADALASLQRPPKALFSASGVNIYGDRDPQEEITEASPAGEGFLADVVREWEHATRSASEAGIRVIHMRNANVLSPKGGMLEVLVPLFKLGLGARLGDGKQVWPWIALTEIPLAIMHLYENTELAGPVNFAAPEAATNAEFTNKLAAALGRPAFLFVPSFAAELAPGGMAEEILLSGRRVVPARLLESGYNFRWPELRPALDSMLGERIRD